MSSRQRFYVGKKDMDDIGGDLEEWITNRVPPVPDGLRCEADVCENDEVDEEGSQLRGLAQTFFYRIEGNHICYTYVCESCGEQASDSYLADFESGEIPTTKGGYAAAPRHCS